jgi:hypothetical protein
METAVAETLAILAMSFMVVLRLISKWIERKL